MKRALIHLIFLISLYGNSQDISGDWSWKSDKGEAQIEFTLEAEGSHYTGYHCAVFQDGDRIDCVDEEEPASIRVRRTAKNEFEGTIRSGYSASKGKLKLVFDPEAKTLLFEILEGPGDIYYLPKRTVFQSSSGKEQAIRNIISSQEDLHTIIENEIQLFETRDSIFISNKFENGFLKSFLKELHPLDTFNFFKGQEMKIVFSPSEVQYLLRQLEDNILSLDSHIKRQEAFNLNPVFSLPPKPKRSENGNYNGLEVALDYSRNRIIFSTPIITSTKEFAVIYVSKGMEGAMSSSINVYKNVEGKWIFYTRLYNAIE